MGFLVFYSNAGSVDVLHHVHGFDNHSPLEFGYCNTAPMYDLGSASREMHEGQTVQLIYIQTYRVCAMRLPDRAFYLKSWDVVSTVAVRTECLRSVSRMRQMKPSASLQANLHRYCERLLRETAPRTTTRKTLIYMHTRNRRASSNGHETRLGRIVQERRRVDEGD